VARSRRKGGAGARSIEVTRPCGQPSRDASSRHRGPGDVAANCTGVRGHVPSNVPGVVERGDGSGVPLAELVETCGTIRGSRLGGLGVAGTLRAADGFAILSAALRSVACVVRRVAPGRRAANHSGQRPARAETTRTLGTDANVVPVAPSSDAVRSLLGPILLYWAPQAPEPVLAASVAPQS